MGFWYLSTRYQGDSGSVHLLPQADQVDICLPDKEFGSNKTAQQEDFCLPDKDFRSKQEDVCLPDKDVSSNKQENSSNGARENLSPK